MNERTVLTNAEYMAVAQMVGQLSTMVNNLPGDRYAEARARLDLACSELEAVLDLDVGLETFDITNNVGLSADWVDKTWSAGSYSDELGDRRITVAVVEESEGEHQFAVVVRYEWPECDEFECTGLWEGATLVNNRGDLNSLEDIAVVEFPPDEGAGARDLAVRLAAFVRRHLGSGEEPTKATMIEALAADDLSVSVQNSGYTTAAAQSMLDLVKRLESLGYWDVVVKYIHRGE